MRKVVLVGAGAVGTAYAYSLVNQGIVTDLFIIDANKDKSIGEAMDLAHGMAFASSNINVESGDYSECNNADLVVITAGANQKPGETRMELLSRNASITRSIIKEVMKNNFKGIILMATNPVDVLTYVAYKESNLNPSKVIGSGTTLDTGRFKFLLGEYFERDPRNIHASIIGEHGDSELPVWSQASIAMESLDNLIARRNNKKDWENLNKIFDNVKNSAYEIIEKKGYTNFGIGMALSRITKAIFNNENSILPVSCYLDNKYGQKDIYMSVPAVINSNGINEIIELKLDEKENELFDKSAAAIRAAINTL